MTTCGRFVGSSSLARVSLRSICALLIASLLSGKFGRSPPPTPPGGLFSVCRWKRRHSLSLPICWLFRDCSSFLSSLGLQELLLNVNSGWKWPLGALIFSALLYFAGLLPLPETWWILPWIVSLIFVGLPHGALDHEVILRLWKPQPPPKWALVVVIVGYLLLAAAVLLGWLLAPLSVFLCFILLTWIHWGLGDLWWSWQRDPAYFTSRFHRIIFALWRGSLPMFLPLVVDPQLYRQVAESICQLFSNSATHLNWMEATSLREIVLGGVLLLGLSEAWFASRRSGTYLINLSEGATLFSAFVVLPPLLSVGLYFVFWHRLRHVLRLMRMEKLSLPQFTWKSAPATITALILLLILRWEIVRHHPHPKFSSRLSCADCRVDRSPFSSHCLARSTRRAVLAK